MISGNKLERIQSFDTPVTVFRCATTEGGSFWYDKDGGFTNKIKNLPDAASMNLPMDFDSVYRDDGLIWLSAADSAEDLLNWFSKQDLIWLVNNNHKIFKIQVAKCRRLFFTQYDHFVFANDHKTSEETIDLSLIK